MNGKPDQSLDWDFYDPERDRPALDVSTLSLDDARRRSWDCRRCAGNGLAIVFAPGFDGRRVLIDFYDDGEEKHSPGTVAAYCTCPAGRKIQQIHEHSKAAHDVYSVTPDLETVIYRASEWLADDPRPLANFIPRGMAPQFNRLAAILANRMASPTRRRRTRRR